MSIFQDNKTLGKAYGLFRRNFRISFIYEKCSIGGDNMIIDFIKMDWGVIILAIGFFILLLTDIHLERNMVRLFMYTTVMILIYSFTCFVEAYLGSLDYYTIMRSLLSAFNYSIINFIIINFILIIFPDNKKLLYIPALINMLASFISIPTKIVFGFSESNIFYRGPLGFLPYIVSAIYLIYLAGCLLIKRRNLREDRGILLFVIGTSAVCYLYPIIMHSANSSWYNLTIIINMVLCYLFLLQKYTKTDPLTGLLNRQSYYGDLDKHSSEITAIVTMDMNGLKTINDNEGHTAGDNALKTLANCFLKAAMEKQRLYRIGGDEYVIICFNSDEAEVIDLIKRIRKEVADTRYACSIGYAMVRDGISVEQAYKTADQMLYKEKKEYYMHSGIDRRQR